MTPADAVDNLFRSVMTLFSEKAKTKCGAVNNENSKSIEKLETIYIRHVGYSFLNFNPILFINLCIGFKFVSPL